MATRLKTVQYAFPALASLTNNTLTTLTQRTIYLPETGTKTFRSVVAHVTFDDIITATGGTLTTKTLNLRLGAAAYTSVANGNTLTNSGENASFHLVADYTAHFTTNWTGASMTCDFQLQINQSTGTTTNMVNVCVTLEITYEYDDTAATHVKTVMIPLDAPVGAIPASATTYGTLPALDTYLPEASKVYRDIFVVVQGNEQRNATTDHTLTISVGSTTVTTGNYEGALQSDRWFRYVFNILAAGFTGQASAQNFQLTASVSRCNHPQCYAVVTYEFDPAATTTVMNSLMLPMDFESPAGGTTSSDYQRAKRGLWIEEPGTITLQRAAYYIFWQAAAAIGGLNMRVGTGSFVTYTDNMVVACGSNGAMIRNDAAFSLVRGYQEGNCDIYRTDTADFMWNLSGFWLLNYTSGKAAAGVGAHNQTILWTLLTNGTAAAADNWTVAATAPVIPETEHFHTAIGTRLIFQSAGTVVPGGYVIAAERLAAEGGVKWEIGYHDIAQTDAEIGVFFGYSQMRDLFLRFPGDEGADRVNLETARRWRVFAPTIASGATGWAALTLIFTYHSILSTVAGTVSGSAGGTVNIALHDAGTGEVLKTTSRVGNGAYSIPFYGDTRLCYVTARESGTLLARSDDDTPTLV